MSHKLTFGKYTIYHNGDFSGDVTFYTEETVTPVELPMEVLRAVVAAEIRANAIRFYEQATDAMVLNKVTEF